MLGRRPLCDGGAARHQGTLVRMRRTLVDQEVALLAPHGRIAVQRQAAGPLDHLDVRVQGRLGADSQRAGKDGLSGGSRVGGWQDDVGALEVAAFDFARVVLCTLCIAWAVKRLLLRLPKG